MSPLDGELLDILSDNLIKDDLYDIAGILDKHVGSQVLDKITNCHSVRAMATMILNSIWECDYESAIVGIHHIGQDYNYLAREIRTRYVKHHDRMKTIQAEQGKVFVYAVMTC